MTEGREVPTDGRLARRLLIAGSIKFRMGSCRWNLELAWIESLSSLRNSGSQVPVRIEFRMGYSRVELGESESADSGLRSLIFQCLIF